MKKLEEILGEKLPVYINLRTKLENLEKVEIPKVLLKKDEFLDLFEGDRFDLVDYPELEDQIDLSGIQKYCLVCSKDNSSTLSISKALNVTPNLKIPYIELNPSSDTGVPYAVFLTWGIDYKLIAYIPRKGNTLKLYGGTIEESGLFNFDWQDKKVLEKSDLLYIVKDVNREALKKYKLEEIYNAFQEFSECTEIVCIDRGSCVSEFEEKIKII